MDDQVLDHTVHMSMFVGSQVVGWAREQCWDRAFGEGFLKKPRSLKMILGRQE